MVKCVIEHCERDAKTRGYCGRHYQSLNKHGDPLYVEKSKLNKIYKENDVYIMEITNRKKEVFKVKISEECIPQIQERKWYIIIPKKGFPYVASSKYMGLDSKYNTKTVYLHRYLTNAKDDDYVDHKNHDSLDYRMDNLIIKTNQENSLNRKGANSNNKSTGVRNVSHIPVYKNRRYVVQIRVGGNKFMDRFETLEEASKVAEEMREKYYSKYL